MEPVPEESGAVPQPSSRQGAGAPHPGSRREASELSRIIRTWISVVLWATILGLLGLMVVVAFRAPTDPELQQQFQELRPYLEGLRRSVALENGRKLSGPQIEALPIEEELANARALRAAFEGENFRVVVYEAGDETNRTTKGFIHCPSIPHPVVEDTDAAREASGGAGRAYAFVDDGWYIEFNWSE
ncbi:MAG: hypothetical protein AAF488_11800 [Planctomycetota bacterium]